MKLVRIPKGTDLSEIPPEELVAMCPGCGTVAPYLGPGGCLDDWDGKTYLFKCCGHRGHLDPSKGGAVTGRAAPD